MAAEAAPPAKRRKKPSSLSALDILQVAAGEADVGPLIDYLVRDSTMPPAQAREAWMVVAEREAVGDDPRSAAVKHRKTAVIERFQVADPVIDFPEPAIERLTKLVRNVSRKNALSSYGDCYCDLRLRLLLPPVHCAFISDQAPYQAAAEFWGDQSNGMIRPLLTTPLKELLSESDTTTDAWLCAAVVVLRELTRGHPGVYVGPAMATALSDPAIGVDRGCFAGAAVGVIHDNVFTPSMHPLLTWLAAARGMPAVEGVAAVVLDGPCGGSFDRFVI